MQGFVLQPQLRGQGRRDPKDNLGFIQWAESTQFGCPKHIDVRHHYLRELTFCGEM